MAESVNFESPHLPLLDSTAYIDWKVESALVQKIYSSLCQGFEKIGGMN